MLARSDEAAAIENICVSIQGMPLVKRSRIGETKARVDNGDILDCGADCSWAWLSEKVLATIKKKTRAMS